MDISIKISYFLIRLFRGVNGNIWLRLWKGETFKLGNALEDKTKHSFTLIFRNSHAIKSTLLGRDPLRFVEAYFRNDIDIEGDFFVHFL